ncbi:sensor histidine kinase [Tessaracoccus antarcticus]|uniref:Histidine kinase/HSP90-like ATPase domain-containing protein n=1 Tax=Tessaracoccus antarcticus TaxID=2479848 RepID=A0A3M0GXP4_9ACTN|nr:ATP-binding protein [Tessaracoccus antarcticus]RMB62146.1 hypothetical protein EAX62_06135 [Tessaracoccus antarcticus]
MRLPRLSQHAFQRPFELGLAGVALLAVPRLASDITADEPLLVLLGLLVLVASQILLILQCLRPSRLTWLITILAALGTILVVVGELLDVTNGSVLWRVDAWLGVTLAYLALLHPRGRQLPTLLFAMLACFTAVALAGAVDWRSQLLEMLFTAAPIALLALARLMVVAMIDEGIAHRCAREVNASVTDITRDALDVSAVLRRETHDSLLHCLQLIGAPWSTLDVGEMRQLCERALQKLSEAPPELGTPTETSMDAALRTALADERCHIIWDVDQGSVPPPVAEAMGGAAREAVRNVMKHCPGEEATVHARSRTDAILVEISDSGPGFDVASHSRGRWGLRNSIATRMESVGGAASVVSSPEGTTVTLAWPASVPPSRHTMGPNARAWLAWTPAPLMIASIANATAAHSGLSTTATAVVWSVLASVVALAAYRVRTKGLTEPQAWGLCVLALLSIIANDLWIDPLTTNGWDLWVPSLAGCMIILALPGRRVRVALAMATLVLGGAFAGSLLTLGQHATFVTHYGAIMAVATQVLMTLVLVFGAAGISGYVHRTRQMDAALLRRSRLAAESEKLWHQWLLRARQVTGDFLSQVASHQLDPTDQATRQEACRLDARIRDELQLWPGDAHVAAVLDRMRREGWDARLDVEDPDPLTRLNLIEILEALPPGGAGQILTASARDGASILTFTGDPLTAEQQAAIQPWMVLVDPDFTQARNPATPVLQRAT